MCGNGHQNNKLSWVYMHMHAPQVQYITYTLLRGFPTFYQARAKLVADLVFRWSLRGHDPPSLGLLQELADHSMHLVEPVQLLLAPHHVNHVGLTLVQQGRHPEHGRVALAELLINVQLTRLGEGEKRRVKGYQEVKVWSIGRLCLTLNVQLTGVGGKQK